MSNVSSDRVVMHRLSEGISDTEFSHSSVDFNTFNRVGFDDHSCQTITAIL